MHIKKQIRTNLVIRNSSDLFCLYENGNLLRGGCLCETFPVFDGKLIAPRYAIYASRMHSDQKRENSPCGCFLFFAWGVNSVLFCGAKTGSYSPLKDLKACFQGAGCENLRRRRISCHLARKSGSFFSFVDLYSTI